jgi:PAS domain S-box-containing protein
MPLLTEPVLDRAPCGFVSFGDDGTMLDVNSTFAELLGYARVELEGWHLQKILPPGGRVFYNTHVFPLLKMHGTVEEIYIALRTRKGVDLPVLMNAVRRERGGRTVNDAVVMRMLQRHAYEEQLLQARRLAENAAAAKDKFLSMMSHDLRAPLTAITGLADLLRTGFHGPMPDDQRTEVEHIRTAADELNRLLTDVLSFAQLDSGRVEVRTGVVPLRAAVERAELLMRVQLDEKSLTFVCHCSDSEAVLADPDRLQQIFLNLLTNAVKFTPEGGTISVSSRTDESRVVISVRDTGVGIERDDLERIFQPFVQVDSGIELARGRGVGLGLAISRELVEAMGGRLTVDSTPGRGSVFMIDLPAARATAAEAHA